MSKRIDLTGQRFGRLVVIEYSHVSNRNKYWKCQCDCGNTSIVSGALLRNGHTKSCGCLVKERGYQMLIKHGLFNKNRRLYGVWHSMRERCFNPNCHAYKDYGGRGITVCSEWNNFEPFYEWAISNGYKDNLTLDRINVNGNYEPNNCRWTDWKTQQNNKRTNIFYTFNGKTQTISQWAKEKGWGRTTLDNRLRAGWSFEKAITTPIDTRFRPRYMKGAN